MQSAESVTSKIAALHAFDPYNFNSYFFVNVTREYCESLLKVCEVGTFIVRESTSQPGYSLDLRDSIDGPRPIRHYFIAPVNGKDGKTAYEMCGRTFCDIQTLIAHYKINNVENTHLVTPAPMKPIKVVIGTHKFDPINSTDLIFARGETLDILRYCEDDWWVAKNEMGLIGLIPSNFVRDWDPEIDGEPTQRKRYIAKRDKLFGDMEADNLPLVPAIVQVVRDRKPSIYAKDQMYLKVGQLILAKKKLANGKMYGTNRDSGFTGYFPFNYVKWTNQPILEEEQQGLPDPH